MSLLIKALDKAMTDKASSDKVAAQSNQGEKQPLELTLESISESEPESTKEISLEEEAGLSAPSKYTKSKAVTNAKLAKSATSQKVSITQAGLQDNKRDRKSVV